VTTETKPRTRSTGLAGVTNLSVLAPLRSGMVPSFEPVSYVGRLRKVLDALQASRQNLRQSELWSVFPDVIGRFGIIHGFRYALVPPDSSPFGVPKEFGTWRLSLNVTFDGGWEPYMRVIYRDIGPLLDLLFCHSPDYPGSRTSTFEQYCNWVRTYEVEAGLFYTDSGVTAVDGHYLSSIEALQRNNASDLAIAKHRQLPDPQRDAETMARAWASPERALALPIRTLKGLYRLSSHFPSGATALHAQGDEGVLRDFAQDVLKDPIRFMQDIEAKTSAVPLPPQLAELRQKWERTKFLFRDELNWLDWRNVPGLNAAPPAVVPPAVPPAVINPATLQSHILDTATQPTHGCLVLLRVREGQAAQALATLTGLAPKCGPMAPGSTGYLVGFTYAGLQALGVTQDRLDALPQEFLEGMEARHALLGDVRTNHPDRWARPPMWKQAGQRADLKTVHVVVQLRLVDNADTNEMHPSLPALVDALGAAGTGLRVLAAEPTRSYRKTFPDGKTHSVGHMGVADGLSQPRPPVVGEPDRGGNHHPDLVPVGELLLGYANGRGDKTPAAQDALLHDGSFLVVRKLRQWMDRLDSALDGTGPGGPRPPAVRTQILEKMVGRATDGKPLHGVEPDAKHDNDFKFDQPAASDACPLHSHIRRSNPRDGRSYTPRILRRGMSYGPTPGTLPNEPRGVMFMAYCASISEQFETMQRWVAGGNSSGVGSAQGDPLLRVPQEGEPYTFRFLQGGNVERVVFPDQPLVQLQWGLYTFVPSLAALRSLAQFTAPAVPGVPPVVNPPPFDPEEADREQVRAMLEDRDKSELVWQWVREKNSSAPQNRAYGRLLGTADEVFEAMKDDGTRYSVKGYGVRKSASIGPNLLGMDPQDPARVAELPVNGAILKIKEDEAFTTAQAVVKAVLAKFDPIPSAKGDIVRRPIDLVNFSDFVLAGLCRIWFGLPDENLVVSAGRLPANPGKPRCPGNLTTASRYIFTPHPRTSVETQGQLQGVAMRNAVAAWLATNPQLPPVAADMKAALATSGSEARLADNIAGMMIGFTPTVQGTFLRVMDTWIREEASLWEHQQALLAESPGATLSFIEAKAALRARLFATMRRRPVPEMLWRSPVGADGKVVTDANKRVVLGIASALTEAHAPDELVFGRDRPGAAVPTVHGCPGYEMAMGVLLAMIGELFNAGTLQPTGSPVLLILTPN
jgi:hypothetical protein